MPEEKQAANPYASPRPAAGDGATSPPIGELIADWFSTAGARVGAITRLALAEARLAAVSAALMAFLAMLAALFVFAAWGLGVAGVVRVFLDAGVALWRILLGTAIVHLLGAVALWVMAMRLGRHVEFRATQRQLFKTPGEPS